MQCCVKKFIMGISKGIVDISETPQNNGMKFFVRDENRVFFTPSRTIFADAVRDYLSKNSAAFTKFRVEWYLAWFAGVHFAVKFFATRNRGILSLKW